MMRKTFVLCTAVLLLGAVGGWAQGSTIEETTIIDETTEVTIVEVDQEEIDKLKIRRSRTLKNAL